MSVPPCCVHDKRARVLSDGFGEGFGTVVDDDVTPAQLTRLCSVNGRTIVTVPQRGDNNFLFETWFTRLALDRAPIDREISKIGKKFLSTVQALYKLEELRSVVDKLK